MLTRKTLSLTDAKKIAAAASARAAAEGWNVVIAIHDAGGHLLYLERADGTQLGWDPLESTCRHASLSIL